MRDVYMHLPRLGWSHGGLLLVTCVAQSASPRTTANITTHHTLGLEDCQYTMWNRTKVLCQF